MCKCRVNIYILGEGPDAFGYELELFRGTPEYFSGLEQVHVAVCCSVLPCVAVCCSVLQCASVCCSVLQCASV